MISLLKSIYNIFDYDYQKELYAKRFEKENRHFDDELEKEQPVEEDVVDANTKAEVKDACSRRTGVITSIRSTNATIDNYLFFDAKVAAMFHELQIGCMVEYLAYNQPNSDFTKVVKVEMVQDNMWDGAPTEEQILETIDSLKSEDPRYFTTHQRSILGLIISRNRQFLSVDTDYNVITVDLDAVDIEFIPKDGDRVYLDCKVQTDEGFADLAGEILEVMTVHPARTQKGEGTVTKIHEDWGVINSDCYYTADIFDQSLQLNKGDTVIADMIECERGIFLWRCLKLTLKSVKVASEQSVVKSDVQQTVGDRNKKALQSVTITDDIRFVLQNAFESTEQDLELRNNSERPQKLLTLSIAGQRRNSQLNFDEKCCPLVIKPGETQKITLYCESKFYGNSKEKIFIVFEKFKLYRTVEIVVGVEEEDKENVEKRFDKKRSRHYANQVWSKKVEIIPGVRGFVLRRFVANRIPSYEVPEKLRSTLLADSSRLQQIANLESTNPALNAVLDFKNYVNRFQTLLYIEEIEQFVNFRQYDRERAHFNREGEYLSLTIENLAEKRPSLIMGDTVRATSPWVEDGSNLAYDGHIHKVQFNKVLLKFNPVFQNKYNGEDYRLEFFFARLSFRKQHYATQKIVQTRGENFLFPSKIIQNEKVQLDAGLDGEGNLTVEGKVLPRQWCNPTLNLLQKIAVKNILRGEVTSLPYVIFGPPGTGKTITLVETILQLIINLPNSRILVATPSNSSADLVSSRLIESQVLKPGDFVRLISNYAIEKDMIPEHLKQYCATADIAMSGSAKDSMVVTESGVKLRCQMKHLGRHKITIGTCGSLSTFLQMDFPRGHFTHVIVDESGQCREPEIMTVISLLSPNYGQIILAGDPYQLGPIILNTYAAERGLRLSFLERIIERFPYRKDKTRFPEYGYDPRLVTKLIYNYRALPSILNTYSGLFYDSELVPMLTATGNKESQILQSIISLLPKCETRSPNQAAFFHGIRGANKQDTDSPSWYNPIEAKHIFLMTIQLYRLNVSPHQIGIITPYQKQVKILRTLFAEADVAMPKIGSVEEFQGQERDIVLISTVRSSQELMKSDTKFSLGFASNPKRLNVCISRARAFLYICGNPHLLSLTEKWRELIQLCVNNDAYIGCDLPDNITTTAQ